MRPTPLLFLHVRLCLAGFLVVLAFGALAGSVSAQNDTPSESSTVVTWVRLCVEPGCTELLDATDPIDGVPVTITDNQSGETLGTCITGEIEPGACQVDVGTAQSLSIALDASAFPDGYEATENPGQLDLVNGSEYQFLLFPVDGFPPADEQPPTGEDDDSQGDVSELPSTGAGTSSDQLWADAFLVKVLALTLAFGLAGTGIHTLAR